MRSLTLFTIGIIFTFIFSSCGLIGSDSDEIRTERLISNEETQNLQNEHDEFGKLHNDFLDFLIAREEFKEEDLEEIISRDYLHQITREFYAQNDLVYNRDEIERSFNVLNRLETNGIDLDAIISNQQSTLCEYVPVLCDLDSGPFNPYPFPEFTYMATGNNTDKVLDFIKRTRRSENEIVQSDEYSDEQKVIILQYHAVARYSSQYWHNQDHNEKDWNKFKEQKLEWNTSKEDIKGGFVTGSVSGAATASAIEVLSQYGIRKSNTYR